MDQKISTIQTSKYRDLRVEIRRYKEHDMVGLRQWVMAYRGSDDERIPTKNGVSFKVKELPAVIAALQEAEREARLAGLFDADEAA